MAEFNYANLGQNKQNRFDSLSGYGMPDLDTPYNALDQEFARAPGAMGGNAQVKQPPGFLDGMLGEGGWGMGAFDMGKGLLDGYLGLKQYGLAKDTLKENKKQFDLNFGAQQKMTNSRMEDRQNARYSANPNAYESPAAYMKKNGV